MVSTDKAENAGQSMMEQMAEAGKGGLNIAGQKLQSATLSLGPMSRVPGDTLKDHVVRQQQGFPQVEQALPKVDKQAEPSFVQKALSFVFGSHNPVASEASTEDLVWLLDNTAYRPAGDEHAGWEVEFVAAYFARNTGQDLTKVVASIADSIGIDDGQLGERANAEKTIAQRLAPFALSIRPGKYVHVAWAGHHPRQLGPSSDGVSSQVLTQLGHHKTGDVVHTSPLETGLDCHAPAATVFAGVEGWTVISDIDDSIKVTMTSSPIGILQSTFFDNPTTIAGMPELYKHINARLAPSWFYLSASPYNLYTFLRPFLRTHYPPGTTILRNTTWQSLDGLLQSLTVGTEAYKTSQIEKIHGWLPKRKIICVGDSTQSDPEAYGNICRSFPGWVQAVFIRKVTGVKGMDEAEKNLPERFEKAFRDVPRSIWQVFDDPQKLYQAVDCLHAA